MILQRELKKDGITIELLGVEYTSRGGKVYLDDTEFSINDVVMLANRNMCKTVKVLNTATNTFEEFGLMTPEDYAELEASAIATLNIKPPVPTTIRMAQCRAQLILIGLDDEVEAIIEAIPDVIKKKVYRSAWEYEVNVNIDNLILLELAPLLNIDLEQFFIDASKL